jgi:hypothetical protein
MTSVAIAVGRVHRAVASNAVVPEVQADLVRVAPAGRVQAGLALLATSAAAREGRVQAADHAATIAGHDRITATSANTAPRRNHGAKS